MEIKYIKSAARVLNRDCVNKGDLDLSKNVLWVSVGQGAADLRAVKVGGSKSVEGLLMYFISIQSDLISIVFIK